MRTITRTAAILALMLLTGFASSALAQRPYRLSESDVRGLMSRLERDSDQFRQSLDHSLDRSRLDGSRANFTSSVARGWRKASRRWGCRTTRCAAGWAGTTT